jgi:peroxiredoxin Q/BCP
MLKPGDRAPDFKLEGDDGKIHSLREFAGKNLILYFYPRDATPGCTVEACEFREHRAALGKKDAVVVGVSPDKVATHQKWQAKEKLGFLLLSDPDHEAATRYGSWGEKTLYGRKFMGIIRSTFIIDPSGKIRRAQYKVSPKGHAEELLADLAGEIGASPKAKAPAAKKPAAKKAPARAARK